MRVSLQTILEIGSYSSSITVCNIHPFQNFWKCKFQEARLRLYRQNRAGFSGGREPVSGSQSKKGDGRLSQFSTSHAGGHWFKSSSAHHRIQPLLNLRKMSRFSQPLLSQLHSLFQRESWLITQLTRGFLNAEMGLASQISNGLTGDFRRPATKL